MKKVLKDYFIPHEGNSEKPHILREVSLIGTLVVALVFFASSIGSSFIVTSPRLLGNIYTAVLVDLTNETRIEENKKPLTINPQLTAAAEMKAQDMVAKNYFAHTSPEGLTPWHWFKKAGYIFNYAGENLAVGFSESEQVNNGWLNSPTHKANIVDAHFTEIGIATMEGTRKGKDAVYVVQMFGSPKAVPPVKKPVTILTQNSVVTSVQPQIAQNLQTASVLSAQASNEPEVEPLFVQEVYKDDSFALAKNQTVSEDSTQPETEDVIAVPQYSTAFERFIANQPLMVSYVLIILMTILSLALVIFLVHEVRVRHYKHFMYGILVFLVLLGLWITNHSFILFDKLV